MVRLFSHLGISEEMASLERYMRGLVTSPVFLLSRPAQHVLTAGGKRIRAAIVFLSARLGGGPVSEAVTYAAAAVELIHAASLVHDDLIDQAPHRRSRPTIHSKWHHDAALLSGDYLFALSAEAIARTGDIRILEFLADASKAICEGEISGVNSVLPLEEALEEYSFKIGCKTAALFEASGKVGALCGGASEGVIACLGRFGYALGMAFQIVDDILDYVGDERTMGKPAGGDLRRGLITLPLIYAVAYDDTDGFLHQVVDRFGDSLQPEEIHQALHRVQISEGPKRAHQDAENYRRQAIEHLQAIGDSATYPLLEDITNLVVERSF
jgi:heptaprenyl diphosphate synthase/octaprenyl-diphosphate synthase